MSYTAAHDGTFLVRVRIDPDDATQVSEMRIVFSASDTDKELGCVFENKGNGVFEANVDVSEYGAHRPYRYQLYAITDAGKLEYGEPGQIDPFNPDAPPSLGA